jgi:hypothetical protein
LGDFFHGIFITGLGLGGKKEIIFKGEENKNCSYRYIILTVIPFPK